MKQKLAALLTVAALALCALPMAVSAEGNVAKIGDKEYATLQEAVSAAPAGTETTITLLGNASGNGVKVPSGSNIIFDLAGFTYTIDGKTVGSAGTETTGFQLLRDSNITFRNGTLASTKAKILIQNYSNLTLDSVNLDGSGMPANQYALSNNFGSVNITGSTSITAPTGGVAFDVYYWPGGGYGDGVSVTVNTTGSINGKIEYGCDSTGVNNVAGKAILNIQNGTFNGSLSTSLTDTGITVVGGSFSDTSFIDYCEDDKTLVQDPNGMFVPQPKPVVATVDGTPYYSLDEAMTAAPASQSKIVDLGGNSVTLTADLTVPAGVTLQNGTINTDTSAITLNEGSKLASMTINKTTKTDLNIVKIVGNNAVLEKVNFNGQYVLGDKEVVRGVVPNAGVSGYTIKECSFVGLRQPGYLEGPGSVVNCYTEGTRGWVVTQNNKVDFSGCTFKNNADNNTCNICIIPNNGAANAYTAADLNALSTANSGAYVIHQDNKVALLDGQCLVSSISGASTGTDLQKFATMDGAMAMGTGVNVKLVNDLALDKMLELNVEGMTLDLGGYTVTASNEFKGSGNGYENDLHLINVSASGVTLKNGTVKTTALNKHAVNLYKAANVTLENLTLDHTAAFTGVPLEVNSSTVSVNGKLNLKVGEKSWEGIDVDGKYNPAGLVFNPGSSVTMTGKEGLLVISTGKDASIAGAEAAGLQDNGDGTFSLKPAPTPKPEEPWTPGPTATPAPAQVLDSTPKTGAVSLAVLPLAGLAFAGVGAMLRKRED